MTRQQRLIHARLWLVLAVALALIVGGALVVREKTAAAIQTARTAGAHR